MKYEEYFTGTSGSSTWSAHSHKGWYVTIKWWFINREYLMCEICHEAIPRSVIDRINKYIN